MAGNIPTPRSFQSILGSMIDAFLSKYGVKQLKVGGPLLRIMEGSAQSDLRNSQDTFNLLDADSIDRAGGDTLDRHARDEKTSRRPATSSSGAISITDTSFTKISTKIYPGAAAPNAGTTALKVSSDTGFPSSGSLYLGRGTVNYEGPIAFTIATGQTGSFRVITLSSATQKFHNVNESVILSQGGNRTIPAGQIVQTATGGAIPQISFRTLYSTLLEAGEVTVNSIEVVCQTPGTTGNVPKDAISVVSGSPFSGASVVNPLPFDNGLPGEDDTSLRERIKNLIQSRTKGTPLALTTAARGVTASDENKTVVSASIVALKGEPTTLFIDDGTGYEERGAGVALEPIVDEALGGEIFFSLKSPRPVTKAFVKSTIVAPFVLVTGSKLAVKVAGVLYEHTFESTSFRAIGNATAYEVIGSINGNADLGFSARTGDTGTTIVLFARNELGEDIEVTAPVAGTDANDFLGFSVGNNYTLRLYKNDELLYKDGRTAVITSAPQSAWASNMASGVQLGVAVDGTPTPSVPYIFTDSDFVTAKTGYTTLANTNSLASWAAVFNAKIPGITAAVSSGRLTLTSNRGAADGASIVLTDVGTSLIDKGMFLLSALTATGQGKDYVFDRNTGQGKLARQLVACDALQAGTLFTRAYLQGAAVGVGTVTIAAGGGRLWAVVDGAADIISTGIVGATTITVTQPAAPRVKYEASAAVFNSVLVGDQMIVWDPNLTTQGVWRVSAVDPDFTWVEIERGTAGAQGATVLSKLGLVFVRSASLVQALTIAAGADRTLASIATEINTQLLGAISSVYRNTSLRLTTDSFANGDIFVAAADVEGQKLGFTVDELVTNNTSHLAAVSAQNPERGTPTFGLGAISVVNTSTSFTSTPAVTSVPLSSGDLVAWSRRADGGVGAAGKYGATVGKHFPVYGMVGDVVTLRAPAQDMLVDDVFWASSPYALGPTDTLGLVIDQDTDSKNYSIPMWRSISPAAGAAYGSASFAVVDRDNGSAVLSAAFGTTDNDFFRDFALFMSARGKSHANAATKTLLWRSVRMGPEGNQVRVSFANPVSAPAPFSFTTENGSTAKIKIRLPSGALRTGLALEASTRFTSASAASGVSDLVTYSYSAPSIGIGGLDRTSNVVTATATAHGFTVGEVVYLTSTDPNYPAGAKTIVSVPGTTSFTYNELGTDVNSLAVATVSSASAAPNFATVVVGDIVTIGTGVSFPSTHFGSWRVESKTATTFTIRRLIGVVATMATPTVIGAATNLSFYPIDTAQTTATLVAAWVNLPASNLAHLVTATVIGSGAGVIDTATGDEYLAGTANASGPTSISEWPLTDGLNYVQISSLSGSAITLKNAVSSDLTASNDFINEIMRLVPLTAASVQRFINSPAISGFYASGEVKAAEKALKLQLASSTAGSAGSIQVAGGTANNVTAIINGTGSVVDSTFSKVTTLSASTAGLVGGRYVAIQGSNTVPKSLTLASGNKLAVAFDVKWKATFSVPVWTKRQALQHGAGSSAFRVYKQGNFLAFAGPGGAYAIDASVTEGDWVTINATNGSVVNNGTFQVVRVSSDLKTFWIEYADGVEDSISALNTGSDTLTFWSYDSIMPGDSFVIDSTAFGSANRGTWTVDSLHASDTGSFYVTGTMVAQGSTALGSALNFVRAVEKAPIRLIKKIVAIGQEPSGSTYSEVSFSTSALATKMSASAGASIQALDKFDFDTDLVTGADAYTYATGLIAEVTKVIYGSASNPAVYPGYVAAGANVNVSGPLTKRIVISLAIRLRSGTIAEDVIKRVKNAVASTVNRFGLAQPIDISSYLTAARGVDGVIAVTPLSPSLESGSDLIVVQANEKPRILDIDQDISVSVVGE